MVKRYGLLLLFCMMFITGCVAKTQPAPTIVQTEQTETVSAQNAPNSAEATKPEVTINPKENLNSPLITETPKPVEEKKDEYKTDPVPSGKPTPQEWQDVKVNKKNQLYCTLSISCSTIFDNLDKFNKEKNEVLPKDGVILPKQQVMFYDGESVFNILQRETKKNKIHMEFETTPGYNSNYVEGINNIYEFDCGELSGWIYKVNGWVFNYGMSRYLLKDGDVIEIVYTCDSGRDIISGRKEE